jgi:Leu/Phe-tRNA-protein transferase
MLVYQLSDELIFPDPRLATREGLLAVGGDLSPERLVLSYRNGIFPWYGENEPILWWSQILVVFSSRKMFTSPADWKESSNRAVSS